MRRFLILTLMLIAGSVAAKDLLVLRDGSILDVKVLQVSDREVSYKKAENPDGPLFSTDVSKILSIKYENGTEQKFEATNTAGQKANKGFSIHAGGAFPTGEFAKDNFPSVTDNEKMGSKTGFNVGIKYVFPIAPQNLGMFVSADLIYNSAKTPTSINNLERSGADVTMPACYNIPLMAGLNYRYDVSSDMALWAEAGVGANFRSISNLDISYEESYDIYSFKTPVSVAVQFGAGILFNDRISVGLNYYSLGSSEVEITNDYDLPDFYGSDKFKEDMGANVVMLRLGYHF